VHTNKCEGLNSHLKHKLKRIRGTRTNLVDGYLAEAVFRQNCRARNIHPYQAFMELAARPIMIDDVEDEYESQSNDWDVNWSDGEED